jgi:hypothetical protein
LWDDTNMTKAAETTITAASSSGAKRSKNAAPDDTKSK